MTTVLVFMVLLLLAANLVTGVLLVKGKTESSVRIEQLTTTESECRTQLTQASAQLDKCRSAYASLKSRAEVEIKRLTVSNSQLGSQRDQLLKYEKGYRELKAKAEEQIRKLMATATTLRARSESAEQTVAIQAEKMKRWQVIVDADVEAQRVLAEANREALALRNDAERILAEAQDRVATLTRDGEAERAAFTPGVVCASPVCPDPVT